MSNFIELEILHLLNQTQDLDEVATRLISTIESTPDNFNLDNIIAFARFLNFSGQHQRLVDFVLSHIENESFAIPWPYFLEALNHTTLDLDEKTVKALIEGIVESGAESESARSKALDQYDPTFREWRNNRKYKIHKDYLNNKRNLLDVLITLRTQQLYEQEKQLLVRLQKLYPDDSEVQREVRDHRQRYALEILSRHSPKIRAATTDDLEQKDPEAEVALHALLSSLLEHVAQEPKMAVDFAIVAFMLESYEAALEILEFSEQTDSYLWLRLEILLKCRRFVELLTELAQVELLLSHEPETFFATAYLRAQALWGLGQKHTAIEVMEGLLTSRPQYRAASAILNIWSSQ